MQKILVLGGSGFIGHHVCEALERAGRELLTGIGAAQAAARPGDAEIEAVIAAGELAARMESVAPGVLDPAGETAETLALYGIDGGPACVRACPTGAAMRSHPQLLFDLIKGRGR